MYSLLKDGLYNSFKAVIPLQKSLIYLSVSEAGPTHSDVLQQAEILHLVAAAFGLKQKRRFDVIGLDAADVVGFLWIIKDRRLT